MEVVLRTDTSESLQIIIIAVTCMLFYVILNTRNSPFDHENSCHLLIIRPNFPKRPVEVIEQISLLFLLDAAMSKYTGTIRGGDLGGTGGTVPPKI